jgi:hypothetical protein
MQEDKIVDHARSLLEDIQSAKLEIEKDPMVALFVESLFEKEAWQCVEKVILPAVREQKQIYVPSFLLPDESLLAILQELINRESRFFDKVVSGVMAQFQSMSSRNEANKYLNKLLSLDVLMMGYEKLAYCAQCRTISLCNTDQHVPNKCERCNSDEWIVHIAHLPSKLKESLINNQFLELYVKESLKKAGYRLISKEVNGSCAYTSIRWRVFPRPVEIDVSAVKRNSLILCECKTSKITLNTVDEKIGQVVHILSSFEHAHNEKPDIDLFFITTDVVEADVPTTEYSTIPNIRCHFYQRNDIPNLPELLKTDKQAIT